MRVFLVEDNRLVLERLVELAHDLGDITIVGTAEDQDQAIADIIETQPHLVILDLHLRSGDGLNVLEATKRNAPHVEVVVFTANDHLPLRQRCIELGADHFFDKLNDIDALDH
jgi:DNA-binding NarL/FixJ family response regulator